MNEKVRPSADSAFATASDRKRAGGRQSEGGVGQKTNRWTGVEIQAVLKGAATLDGEWKAVEGATAAEKAAMRFFKVVVEVQ